MCATVRQHFSWDLKGSKTRHGQSWEELDVGGAGPSVHVQREVPAGGGLWLGAVALAGLGLGGRCEEGGQRHKRAVSFSFILPLFARLLLLLVLVLLLAPVLAQPLGRGCGRRHGRPRLPRWRDWTGLDQRRLTLSPSRGRLTGAHAGTREKGFLREWKGTNRKWLYAQELHGLCTTHLTCRIISACEPKERWDTDKHWLGSRSTYLAVYWLKNKVQFLTGTESPVSHHSTSLLQFTHCLPIILESLQNPLLHKQTCFLSFFTLTGPLKSWIFIPISLIHPCMSSGVSVCRRAPKTDSH